MGLNPTVIKLVIDKIMYKNAKPALNNKIKKRKQNNKN